MAADGSAGENNECRSAASDDGASDDGGRHCLRLTARNQQETKEGRANAAAIRSHAIEGSGPTRTSVIAQEIRLRNTAPEEVEGSESATGLRVARYSQIPDRRLQIELENGQIWRQVPGGRQLRLNLDRNRTVDITSSGSGSYELSLNELSQTIKVKRIR